MIWKKSYSLEQKRGYPSLRKRTGKCFARNANVTIDEITDITEQDLKRALEKIKKSPGEGEIVNELFKYGGNIHKIKFLRNEGERKDNIRWRAARNQNMPFLHSFSIQWKKKSLECNKLKNFFRFNLVLLKFSYPLWCCLSTWA